MSEPEYDPFDSLEGVYEPKAGEWLARLVMCREDEQPMNKVQTVVFATAISANALEDSMHSLEVNQDVLSDVFFVEFTISGRDKEDALENSLGPVHWAGKEVEPNLGMFYFDHMQLARVGDLASGRGTELADAEYDVTEEALEELAILTNLSHLLIDAAA